MVREYTNKIYEAIEEEWLDKDCVINACLGYMSEDDVKEMCWKNCLFEGEE